MNEAPWVNQIEDVLTASDASLRRTLVTGDGGGPAFKEAALDELIRRGIQARWDDLLRQRGELDERLERLGK
jgi:hypothetical protein